jgi:hypothetical protein
MTTTLADAAGNPPTIRRGTSPTFTFAVKNPDGTPKNLVGATEATFAIAFDRNPAARDLQLTLGDGVTHDGADGNVTVAFTKEQTDALPVGNRWCELWLTDFAGSRDLVGEGKIAIIETLVTVP